MKIESYPDDNNISLQDKVTGTDADDSKKTKNYTFQAIKDFFIAQGFGANTTTITPQAPLYKSYFFNISQTGLDAPVITTFQNEIGNVVWTRTSTGIYRGTLANAFTLNKTHPSFINKCQHSGLYTRNIFVNINSVNYFEVWVSNELESFFDGVYENIEIRVYN